MSKTIADIFFEVAGAKLEKLGFRLNDERYAVGRYGEMGVALSNRSNLHLHLSFDLFDTNTASVWFGRQWRGDGGWLALSSAMFVFAHYYNVDFPKHHRLGYKDEIRSNMERIVRDLERVLPVVCSEICKEDLEAIEGNAEFGSRAAAVRRYGDELTARVTCEDFVQVQSPS